MGSKSVQKFALVVLLMFWASFAVAQRDGVATFSAADVHEFDTVNLTTLVPTFNFPVISKGVGALPGNITLSSPQVCHAVTAHQAACIGAAISATLGEGIDMVEEPMLGPLTTVYTTVVNGACNTYTVTAFLGPDNLTSYSLPSTTLHYPSNCTGGNTATVTANDGSGYTVALSSVNGGPIITSISNTSGWTGSFGSTNTVSDAFSNSISSTAGSSSGSFTDSLGAVTTYQITNSDITGWQYVDTTGTNQDVNYTQGSALAFAPYGCNNSLGPTTFTPTTSINYPDSTKISIGWDKNGSNYSGLIGSITLRTGGTITYTYTTSGMCTPWYNTALTRATADGNTTYSLTTASNSTTTTVKDPGLNKTVYVFVGSGNLGTVGPAPTFISTIDRYQNTGSVGTPAYTHISETAYCYNTHISDCSTYLPAYPITQLDTYQYTYNGATQVTMSHDVKQYDSTYGLITSDAATDSITSQTITTTYVYGTYSSGSCSAITNTAIVDHPCTITTKNGSTWLSGSTYSYNSNGALTSSSACLSSTCTGSSALTTTYTPTTQGTYSAIQDPNGQTVNYTYGSCNSLMPTDITTTVNSIAIDHKATWNCDAGVVTDTTDANSNEADYAYDSMDRLHTYHDYMGDTNTTTYDYGTPTLDHVKVTDNIGVVSYQYVDGLGRPSISQIYNGTNYDTVSHAYGWKDSGNNALTNFQTTTSGGTSSAACTATLGSACTTVTLTALTNPIAGPYKTTDANSGTVTYAVNSKDFSVTAGPAPSGEHTKVVDTEVDGFGRITSVCPLENSGGTNCGQTMTGSGILTSNTYSFPSAGVSEVQTTRGSQTHTTKADAVGRTTSYQNPEAGTVTYTYDSATTTACGTQTSKGDLLEISHSGSSIYECYAVDGLHRPTDVGNTTDNATNPCKRFRYDSTANNAYTKPTGYPASGNNLIGRLVEASTDDCTFPLAQAHMITDEWFAYDAMGRMTDYWETTPNSGGFYHTTVAYDADGVITSLSGIPTYSSITWGNFDSEDRPTSMKYGTTTMVSATAGNGFSYDAAGNPTNVPIGTGGDQDAFTWDNLGNMKTYTFNVGTKADGGTLTYNSIGSVAKLVINDTIASSTDSQTCAYAYDDVARLTSESTVTGSTCNGPMTYTYDQYDNLNQSGTFSWTATASSTNNQTTGSTYDSDGNVKTDGVNSYTWNAYEKILSARSGNSAAVCGTSGTCYTYDAFGNLVELQQASSTYRQYVYSPVGMVAHMNGQTPVWALLPAPGSGSLWLVGSTPTTYFVHKDWTGTERMVDTISGTNYNAQAYTAYGQQYDTLGSAFQLFAGDIQDDSGDNLYLTPNRNLFQNSGRWLSPDPAHSGWNAYAYVTDPNTQTDPSGLGVEGQQDEQYLCPDCTIDLSGGCNAAAPACIDPPCCTDTAMRGTGSLGDLGPSINSGFNYSGGTWGQFGAIGGGGIVAKAGFFGFLNGALENPSLNARANFLRNLGPARGLEGITSANITNNAAMKSKAMYEEMITQYGSIQGKGVNELAQESNWKNIGRFVKGLWTGEESSGWFSGRAVRQNPLGVVEFAGKTALLYATEKLTHSINAYQDQREDQFLFGEMSPNEAAQAGFPIYVYTRSLGSYGVGCVANCW